MREKPKSLITLEMLGLTPAAQSLNHALEHVLVDYPGYGGHEAHCYLDVYDAADMSLRVYIVTETPDNPGTSITNRAEVVAETLETIHGLDHVFQGDDKGRPVNPRFVYIEHYPRSKQRGDFDENFSVVTFSGGVRSANRFNAKFYADAQWTHLDRSEVERLIGRKFKGYDFD